MRKLLSKENASVLAQLAWSRVLLAFDFDGTLAPIVEDRDDAGMRESTARLFSRIAALYPCAVISGRSQDDVASRLGGAPVKYVIGNHGLEPGAGLDIFEEEVSEIRPRLEAVLSAVPGLDVEDKRYSLALHYRKARRKRDARGKIREAVSSLPIKMREIPGKFVVNLVPEHAPNKGDAVLRLRDIERADTALYVGDDITDEDVFRLDQPGRLLTVRVGESRTSAANYFLKDQREIDRLLDRLIASREKGASR